MRIRTATIGACLGTRLWRKGTFIQNSNCDQQELAYDRLRDLGPRLTSRSELFDGPYCGVCSFSNSTRTSIDSNMAKQLFPQSSLPTELVRAGGRDEGFVEEVDNFRFVVSKSELERASKQKIGMMVGQQTADGKVMQYYMDASLVASMTESSGPNDRLFELSIPHTDFLSKVTSLQETENVSNRIADHRDQQRGQPYDPSAMTAAEEQIEELQQKPLPQEPAIHDKQQASVAHGVPHHGGGSASSKAWRTIHHSLASTLKQEVQEDIIGVTFILAVATVILAACDGLLTATGKVGALVHKGWRRLPLPAAVRKHAVVLVGGAFATVLLTVGRHWYNARHSATNLDWLTPAAQ